MKYVRFDIWNLVGGDAALINPYLGGVIDIAFCIRVTMGL